MTEAKPALAQQPDTTRHQIRCDSTCMCGTPGKQLTGLRHNNSIQMVTHQHGKRHVTTIKDVSTQ